MNHYPFLTVNNTGEVVTYSAMVNEMFNVFVEKSADDNSASIIFEVTHADIKLVESVNYAETEIKKWESNIAELREPLLALARDKANFEKSQEANN